MLQHEEEKAPAKPGWQGGVLQVKDATRAETQKWERRHRCQVSNSEDKQFTLTLLISCFCPWYIPGPAWMTSCGNTFGTWPLTLDSLMRKMKRIAVHSDGLFSCASPSPGGAAHALMVACVESLVSSSGRAASPGVQGPRQCASLFWLEGTGVVQPGFKFWLSSSTVWPWASVHSFPSRVKVECCEAPVRYVLNKLTSERYSTDNGHLIIIIMWKKKMDPTASLLLYKLRKCENKRATWTAFKQHSDLLSRSLS